MAIGDRSLVPLDGQVVRKLSYAVAVLATLYLTAGLVILFPTMGYTLTRVAFFLLIAGVPWVGAAGALLDRPPFVVLAAAVLVLLGFWQAVR